MDATLETLRNVGTAGIAAFVTWLGIRQSGRKNRTDAAQSLFNEVQEERAELKKDRTELRERLDRMERESRAEVAAIRQQNAEKLQAVEGRVTRLERDNLLLKDFAQDLRNHIRLGIGPPPPDWPEGLL